MIDDHLDGWRIFIRSDLEIRGGCGEMRITGKGQRVNWTSARSAEKTEVRETVERRKKKDGINVVTEIL